MTFAFRCGGVRQIVSMCFSAQEGITRSSCDHVSEKTLYNGETWHDFAAVQQFMLRLRLNKLL